MLSFCHPHPRKVAIAAHSQLPTGQSEYTSKCLNYSKQTYFATCLKQIHNVFSMDMRLFIVHMSV